MKKIKKIFKKLSVGLAVAFSALVALPVFGSAPMLSASALSKDEYSIYDYEWANYFDVSEIDLSLGLSSITVSDVSLTETGILFAYKEDFSGGLSSPYPLSQVSNSYILPVCPDLQNGETYTFSCDLVYSKEGYSSTLDTFEIQINIYTGSWLTFSASSGENFSYSYDSSVAPDFTRMDLWFNDFSALLPALYEGVSVEFANMALYKGTETYEYTPYFYDLEEIPDNTPDVQPKPDPEPTPPSDDGTYNEGYEAGYQAGLGYSKYSFFYNARLRMTVLNADGSLGTVFENAPIGYVSQGVAFSPLVAFLETNGYNSSNIAGVRLSLIFYSPVPATLFHVRGVGNVDAFANYFNLLTDRNVEYRGRFVEFDLPNVGYGIQAAFPSDEEAESQGYTVNFSAIYDWDVYDINNLVGLTLLDYTAEYDTGYQAGYQAGEDIGYKNGYDTGYGNGLNKGETNLDNAVEESYDNGYRIGYDDGFATGLKEDFEFLGLVTAVVDAPVHYIMSLFSFEIFGYNMQALFISILSACLILAIVNFFTKGRSE